MYNDYKKHRGEGTNPVSVYKCVFIRTCNEGELLYFPFRLAALEIQNKEMMSLMKQILQTSRAEQRCIESNVI